jgi:hypothetical protein
MTILDMNVYRWPLDNCRSGPQLPSLKRKGEICRLFICSRTKITHSGMDRDSFQPILHRITELDLQSMNFDFSHFRRTDIFRWF